MPKELMSCVKSLKRSGKDEATTFDIFYEGIMRAEAKGLMGFSYDMSHAFTYMYDRKDNHEKLFNGPVVGNSSIIRRAEAEDDQPNVLRWRYVFSDKVLYIWKIGSPKDERIVSDLQEWLYDRGYPVSNVRWIIFDPEKFGVVNPSFRRAHLMS